MTPDDNDDLVPRVEQLEELYRRLALAHLEDRDNLARLARRNARESLELKQTMKELAEKVDILVGTMNNWIERNPGTGA